MNKIKIFIALLLFVAFSCNKPDNSNGIFLHEEYPTKRPTQSQTQEIGVKVYRAVLTQFDSDNPTAAVFENTLGGDLVWTRTSTGQYLGTISTATFPGNQTHILMGSNSGFIYANRAHIFSIHVITQNQQGVNEDSWLFETAIDIRVYDNWISNQ